MYYPAWNSLAKRSVQTLKSGLQNISRGSLESRIAKVLFTYRIASQGTTVSSPAELLIVRIPQKRLDMLHVFLNPAVRVEEKQSQQKSRHDTTSRNHYFTDGEAVLHFAQTSIWKGLDPGKDFEVCASAVLPDWADLTVDMSNIIRTTYVTV